MCKDSDILWYLAVSFSAILSYQTPVSSPPSISVLCKLLAEDPRALARSWQRLKLFECLGRLL